MAYTDADLGSAQDHIQAVLHGPRYVAHITPCCLALICIRYLGRLSTET